MTTRRKSGWSIDDGAAALNLTDAKDFSRKALDAMETVAILLALDPAATLADMSHASECLSSRKIVEARIRLERIRQTKIDQMIRRQRGLVDRNCPVNPETLRLIRLHRTATDAPKAAKI